MQSSRYPQYQAQQPRKVLEADSDILQEAERQRQLERRLYGVPLPRDHERDVRDERRRLRGEGPL